MYVGTFNLINNKILRGVDYRLPYFVRQYVRPPVRQVHTHTHQRAAMLIHLARLVCGIACQIFSIVHSIVEGEVAACLCAAAKGRWAATKQDFWSFLDQKCCPVHSLDDMHLASR